MNTENAWTHFPLGDQLRRICHFINKWDYETTSDPYNLHHTPHPSMTPQPCLVITVMVYGFLVGAPQQQHHPARALHVPLTGWHPHWWPEYHACIETSPKAVTAVHCTFVYHEVWRVCCSGMTVTPEWCARVASQWQSKYECVYMCVYTTCLSIYTCAVPQNDFIACLSLSEYVCIFVHHVILHSFPLRIRPFISRSPCVGVSHGANEERTEQGRVSEWGGRKSKNRLFWWQKRGDSDR